MGTLRVLLLVCCCITLSSATEPARARACVVELECAECVPEHLPLVTSHRAANGSVAAAEGDELLLECGGGHFLLYPLLGVLSAVCEGGMYRVRQDGALRHLLELGCQENVFEDVLHQVEYCGAPLQGRAYQTQAAGGGAGVRHLATLCFDADRALATRAHASGAPHNALSMAPHSDRRSPLSLLGNFNHMFDAKTRHDADKLYSDDIRLNRRLRELFKHEHVSFAAQTLTAGKLLSGHYFEDQNMRVAEFPSNRVAAWGSVVAGNLRHVHRDVARLLRRGGAGGAGGALRVHAGTHGVMALRTAGGRKEVYLQPGRFPVPKYIWTVVVEERSGRALALVLLNDPFVAVSEIREAVFCESVCGRAGWLRDLRRHRNYESPVGGLVFCCSAHNLTALVPEMPAEILRAVPHGTAGLLLDSYA